MFALGHVRTKHVAIGMLGGVLLLTNNPASAREGVVSPSATPEVRARERPDACRELEAETLQSGLDALLGLGECQQRAGRNASAWYTFLEAEAVARAQKDRARAKRAAEQVAALAPRLTRVVFVVPRSSRVPGLTLRLGDNTVPPSAWETPIPVDAGALRVSASANGYRAWSLEIDASHSPGEVYRVDVPVLVRARAEPRRATRDKAYRTAGVVTGSVGLAGLGAGALFGAMAHSAESASACAKSAAQCPPNKSNSATYGEAAAVSLALGGALLATGVTLFVLAPSADQEKKESLRVAARYAAGGGRLQLEGVW
jgi:hypothetical protein